MNTATTLCLALLYLGAVSAEGSSTTCIDDNDEVRELGETWIRPAAGNKTKEEYCICLLDPFGGTTLVDCMPRGCKLKLVEDSYIEYDAVHNRARCVEVTGIKGNILYYHLACADRTFGLDCSKKCNCDNANEVCDKTSGECTLCRDGYNGKDCQDCDITRLTSYATCYVIQHTSEGCDYTSVDLTSFLETMNLELKNELLLTAVDPVAAIPVVFKKLEDKFNIMDHFLPADIVAMATTGLVIKMGEDKCKQLHFDNITLAVTCTPINPCPSSVQEHICKVPLGCDFENSSCYWDLDIWGKWKVTDHLTAQLQPTNSTDIRFVAISRPLRSDQEYCLSFWYRIYDPSGQDALVKIIVSRRLHSGTMHTIFEATKHMQTWHEETFVLPAVVYKFSDIIVSVSAGQTTTSWVGFDDVSITPKETATCLRVSSCGYKTYNTTTHICCKSDHTVYHKDDGCPNPALLCGRSYVADNNTEKCCHGAVVHAKDRECPAKCGRYLLNYKTRCCNGSFLWYSFMKCPSLDICNGHLYLTATEQCCYGAVIWNKRLPCPMVCGDKLYNTNSHKCCNERNVVPYYYVCAHLCGRFIFHRATQKCCAGNNIVKIDNDCPKKCGRTYITSNWAKCCYNAIQWRGDQPCPDSICGYDLLYNSQNQKCCPTNVLAGSNVECPPVCGNRAYTNDTQKCCSGGYYGEIVYSKTKRCPRCWDEQGGIRQLGETWTVSGKQCTCKPDWYSNHAVCLSQAVDAGRTRCFEQHLITPDNDRHSCTYIDNICVRRSITVTGFHQLDAKMFYIDLRSLWPKTDRILRFYVSFEYQAVATLSRIDGNWTPHKIHSQLPFKTGQAYIIKFTFKNGTVELKWNDTYIGEASIPGGAERARLADINQLCCYGDVKTILLDNLNSSN